MLTIPVFLALALQNSTPVQLPGLDPKDAFPFVLPWDDALKGTASDVSFLNVVPAGKNGRIVAKNGHFYEAKTGARIRFFGTNCGAEAAFPKKSDADKIAAHMAKLGINMVRLHHLNNGWAVNTGGSIWKRGRTYIEIDPVQVDKLDYFVAALKRHGVYVNVNLQTSREYIPELGLPESVRQIPNFGKKVDKFYEPMIQLQLQYARQLLDRRNPYTGLKYADDPAVAKVEINNENSLVGWPGESAGARLAGLPEPFLSDLRTKWMQWLRKTYMSTAALKSAWGKGSSQLGDSLTGPASTWTHENQSGGDVKFEVVQGPNGSEGAPTLKAVVTSNPGPNWHVQAHLTGLDLAENSTYTVQFRGRASGSATVGIEARLDQPDWHNVGLGGSADLTPEWRDYAFSFRTSGVVKDHNRVGFVLGDVRGAIEIQNLRVQPGALVAGLPDGESLEAGNVSIPTASFSPRFRDWTRFVADTERAYSVRMRRFLREELGFKQTNLIDSQISWGGLTSLYREQDSSYADNHAYWNHPTFLGSDWDAKNYRVDRRALVSGLPSNLGTLGDLALFRVAGKPYSVSEYNHPAPSDYQVEMMPLYATFAAFQDWDAIYTFDYGNTGTGVANGQYSGYFESARNPAKAAFFPASALVFRRGLIPPAAETATLVLPAVPWETGFTPAAVWSAQSAPPRPLEHRVSLRWKHGASATSLPKRGAPTLSVVASGEKRAYVASSPYSVSITGFVGSQNFRTVAGQFGFGKLPTDFASLMLVPVDGRPLATSKRMLLTLASRVENRGMAWNAARDSVSDQWGTAPVMAERVPVRVNLAGSAKVTVYALSPRGERRGRVANRSAGGQTSFSTAGVNSMWFEIIR